MADVEVYVLEDNGATQAWISKRYGPLTLVESHDSFSVFRSRGFRLTVSPHTDLDGATSYFISGDDLPWDSDEQLAIQVHDALSLDVAYDSGTPTGMEIISSDGLRHIDT